MATDQGQLVVAIIESLESIHEPLPLVSPVENTKKSGFLMLQYAANLDCRGVEAFNLIELYQCHIRRLT
ncbi:hypothetical protein RGCCGE502_17100 [Rhizobium grahamii CCGE 502]|uniref:Uncharacterized protein n=1 Tax=Rhizobium grahamii CCGE 502 TaxID=990285 RepID=S3HGB8_9HYPH|nr:hypothetical protein RGCCGE502_17100 [Rhizobium grahamii CCGE 502]